MVVLFSVGDFVFKPQDAAGGEGGLLCRRRSVLGFSGDPAGGLRQHRERQEQPAVGRPGGGEFLSQRSRKNPMGKTRMPTD